MAWLEILGHPQEYPILFPEIRGETKNLVNDQTPHTKHWLKAYPNPSNGPINLDFTVPEGVTKVEITMYDATGRVMQRATPGSNQGTVTLAQPGAPGFYLATLSFDGIKVEEVKISLTR
jgi:hypothetical protein